MDRPDARAVIRRPREIDRQTGVQGVDPDGVRPVARPHVQEVVVPSLPAGVRPPFPAVPGLATGRRETPLGRRAVATDLAMRPSEVRPVLQVPTRVTDIPATRRPPVVVPRPVAATRPAPVVGQTSHCLSSYLERQRPKRRCRGDHPLGSGRERIILSTVTRYRYYCLSKACLRPTASDRFREIHTMLFVIAQQCCFFPASLVPSP